MPSHPIDFQIQANVFSTPEIAAVFDERRKFCRWLTIESALATAQGKLGIIPLQAAQEIASCATLDNLDLVEIAAQYQKSRNSIMPVVKALRAACRDKHGEFVHFGATTQDILDTAQILELRDSLTIVYRDLKKIEILLFDLTSRHKTTPMIARTHGQQALPTTFGMKSAVWLAEIRRHLDRLIHLAPRVLIGQLSGAVGTMAALGPEGRKVSAEVMKILGLSSSTITWHTSRDNMAETANFFALFTATLEKIANEILQLGKTEIGELREPAPASAISSSTMPHKRNPVLCQRVAVLARQTRVLSASVTEAMVHEHERDARALWSELLAMPQISIYSCAALHYIKEIVSALEVDTARMRHNLYLHREMVVSEWLLFRLGVGIGKMKAQEILHQLIRQAEDTGKTLRECLLNAQEIAGLLSVEDLSVLDQPEKYCGLAVEIVDDVLADVKNKRASDPEFL